MHAVTVSGVLWVLFSLGCFGVLIVLFFLPTLVGLIRGVDGLALVFLVNLIGAPALIGWPAAMILAAGPRRLPPEPAWPPYPGVMHGPGGTWPPDPRGWP
jgi:hypothetical protein